jgi:hypothetical protein
MIYIWTFFIQVHFLKQNKHLGPHLYGFGAFLFSVGMHALLPYIWSTIF